MVTYTIQAVISSSGEEHLMYAESTFNRFSKETARATGHPTAFVVALVLIIVWGGTGPIFHFSDTWQLVINTSTTIVTFLMVFLIQSTQNRDSAAVQLKLDELIRCLEGAHNSLLDLEQLSEQELDLFRKRYGQLAEEAREILRRGGADTDRPDMPAERGPRNS
jgi:low affinity Fe/Cu permease